MISQPVSEPISALNKIRISECGEPLVDLRVHCPTIFVRPDIGLPYVRLGVGDRLNEAQTRLSPGQRIFVHRALRTLDMQRDHWDEYKSELRSKHPKWPKSVLHRQVNRYFAPYDQTAPPGHCTGAAVDIYLTDERGIKLDLVSPFKDWEAALTRKNGLSPIAANNRYCMLNAMLGSGFSNCKDEFWHYSYGDSAWAVRCGETQCQYGLINH